MTKACVWIEDIADAFQDLNKEWRPYVNTNSGEVVFVPLTQEGVDEFDQEDQDIFLHIEEYSEYIPLPEQKELREYDIMEEYTDGLINAGYKKRLSNALNMNKPFRNFRAQVRLLGLEEDYNHYRYMIFTSKARLWCIEHDIPYEVDSDEVKEYFEQIEEDEKFEKELEDFDETLDEFEYEEDYEDYFE